jgi:uncharacterized membrane protein YeiH
VAVSMIAAAAVHTAVLATQAATAAVAASAATGKSGVESFITTTVPSIIASVLPSGVTTTAPDAARVGVAVTVSPVWELLAVFAGALSGGLAAVRRKFDIVGVLTLSIVTGMGGGIIRDVLLQHYGIAAFHDNRYLFTALVAAAVVFFFSGMARGLRKPLLYVDAVSLGLFVVVGADKALRADLTILPAIMLGVITATGGSVVRDLLSDEVPVILQPGALYSTAALIGSTVFVLAVSWLGVVKEFAALFAIGLAVGLRLLAMWRGWKGPVPRDYTSVVAALPHRILSRFTFYRTYRARGGSDTEVRGEVEDVPYDESAASEGEPTKSNAIGEEDRHVPVIPRSAK